MNISSVVYQKMFTSKTLAAKIQIFYTCMASHFYGHIECEFSNIWVENTCSKYHT